jgi:hypothetical protein
MIDLQIVQEPIQHLSLVENGMKDLVESTYQQAGRLIQVEHTDRIQH